MGALREIDIRREPVLQSRWTFGELFTPLRYPFVPATYVLLFFFLFRFYSLSQLRVCFRAWEEKTKVLRHTQTRMVILLLLPVLVSDIIGVEHTVTKEKRRDEEGEDPLRFPPPPAPRLNANFHDGAHLSSIRKGRRK